MLKTSEKTSTAKVHPKKSSFPRNGTSGIPVLLRSGERQIKTRTPRSPDCTYSQLHQLASSSSASKRIAARNVSKGLLSTTTTTTTTSTSEAHSKSQTEQQTVMNGGVVQQKSPVSASAVPVHTHLMALIGSATPPPPPPPPPPRPASLAYKLVRHQTEANSPLDDDRAAGCDDDEDDDDDVDDGAGCGCRCCSDGGCLDGSSGGPSRVPSRAAGPWWLSRELDNSRILGASQQQNRRKLRKAPDGSFAMPSQGNSFCRLLQRSPPSLPPALLKGLDRREPSAIGRVKVMLRMSSSTDSALSDEINAAEVSFMQLDARKKQVTIYEPQNQSLGPVEKRNLGIAAPKMFAFDNVFSCSDSQSEVCSRALSDILPAVVNGSDACLFTYGYSKLGKTRTMVGTCDSVHDLGAMPCATWWLFKLIDEQKQRTGARFSVRVSATEIAGKDEIVRDLLASYAHGTEIGGFSSINYRREDPTAFGGYQLQDQCELRAPSAEKAAYYLDTALASRSTEFPESDGISHFLFTFHIYQYSVDKSGKGAMDGGRSRLYLLDLGSCDKQSQVYSSSKSYRLSMANLGNVILAMFNGQKHVPYKDGKLTQVLREILGNATCRASMLAHVSPSPSQYTESLATIQLASRIHRLRHKKWKYFHSGSGEGLSEDSFGSHHLRHGETGNTGGLRSSSSDFDYTSSDTCETVIFVGQQPREGRTTIHEEPANGKQQQSFDPLQVVYNHRAGFAQVRRMHGSLFSNNNNSSSSNNNNDDALMREECSPAFINHPTCFEHDLQFTDNFLNAIRANQNRTRCNYSSSEANNRRRSSECVATTPATSDEFWVDGPKIRRSKMHVSRRRGAGSCGGGATGGGMRTLAVATGPETWVDGPTVDNGLRYLDNQKRVMIENWIDMQSAADAVGSNNDLDTGSDTSDGVAGCCQNDYSASFARAVDGVVSKRLDPATVVMFNEIDVVSTVDSVVSGDDTEKSDSAVASDSVTYQEIGQLCAQYGRDSESRLSLRDIFRETPSLDDTSLEAHDDTSEDQRWISLAHAKEEGRVSPIMDLQRYLPNDRRFIMELNEMEEIGSDMIPSNEVDVDGAGEAVYMTDSWVQVSEVDLQEPKATTPPTTTAPATRINRRRTASAIDYESHPLSALSSESLAISFTNSSRMSWDSGLNAVRRALATATLLDDENNVDEDEDAPFDFGPYAAAEELDARSICSEPGTSSSIALSMERLRKLNAFECKSLRESSSGLVMTRSRSFSTSNHSLCSCDDCHIKWLRRPDGASDPQLDRHPSSSTPPAIGSWKSTQDEYPIITTQDNYSFATRTFEGTNEDESERTMGSGRSAAITNDGSADIRVPSKNNGASDGGVKKLQKKFDLRRVTSPPSAPCTLVLDVESSWCDQSIVSCQTDVREGGAAALRTSDDHPEEDEKEQPSSTATSSGYNSMPRDGEGSGGSVSAVEDSASLNSEEVLLSPGHTTPQTTLNSSSEHNGSSLKFVDRCASTMLPSNLILLDKHGLASFELRVYDEEDVTRMERRRAFEKELELQRRCSRIRFLRNRQEELRHELKTTKQFLMVDASKWSYDLFVEQSMDAKDPAFLEAFEMETSILEKRVVACKSHLMMVTCFDVTADSIADDSKRPMTEETDKIPDTEKCVNT